MFEVIIIVFVLLAGWMIYVSIKAERRFRRQLQKMEEEEKISTRRIRK